MWDQNLELEKILKEEHKATIRCIPDDKELDPNKTPCVLSGKVSGDNIEILIARAY
jgi:hypothetical protein